MDRSIKWTLIGISAVSVIAIIGIVAALLSEAELGGGAGGIIALDSAQYRTFWPLTVPRGEGECREPFGYRRGQAVFITEDAVVYGMNDEAIEAGYPPIEDISKRHPDFPEFPVHPDPILQPTLDLCR